jgi:hypothetical protein
MGELIFDLLLSLLMLLKVPSFDIFVTFDDDDPEELPVDLVLVVDFIVTRFIEFFNGELSICCDEDEDDAAERVMSPPFVE